MFANLSKIRQSCSVAFADYVRACERDGQYIVKMQTGDPDFSTHPNVVQAAYDALLKGETKYCDSRGLLGLRNALSDKLLVDNKIKCSASDNILITHGAIHGIGMAIRALLNTGDECIIIEPYWRAYEMNVLLAGGIPVIVQASRKTGFHLEAERVIERITSRTKAIIINTPNNPSGAVYARNEIVKLAITAAENGIYIISDEVYESIVFHGAKHYSVASDPSVFNWIVSAFSFSKTYAMTGWRIGYLVACKALIDELLKLSQFSITSLSPYNQLAALVALKDGDVRVYAEKMRTEYEKRRNRICQAIKGTWLEREMTLPEGTFYALIGVSRFGMPSLELAKKIVDTFNVSFTPGVAFGGTMDGYLRMCFATSDENIDQAIDVLIRMERQWF